MTQRNTAASFDAGERGLTLLELLIVVGIISILAVMGVVSLQGASMRSKVAASRSNQRTVVTALETYHGDHNSYPTAGALGDGPDAAWARWVRELTTPVAYLTGVDGARDPFKSGVPPVYRVYSYLGFYDAFWQGNLGLDRLRRKYGAWMMHGFGPMTRGDTQEEVDRWPQDADGDQFLPYDATNGTLSAGLIMRRQQGE